MAKFKKSQILMLSLLAALLFLTPLISPSLRPKYHYFIFNLLIIALGSEAGLIAVFSKPLDHDKEHPPVLPPTAKPVTAAAQEAASSTEHNKVSDKGAPSAGSEKKGRVVEKSASEKINVNSGAVVSATSKVHKVRKCPSTPSLFFIGGGESEVEDVPEGEEHEEEEGEEVPTGEISRQELFTKAETLIGDFYKQLKMQREESWKKIHGFCQKHSKSL